MNFPPFGQGADDAGQHHIFGAQEPDYWDPTVDSEYVPSSLGTSNSEQKTYKNLFVSRIPHRIQHQELSELFAQFNPKSATIMTDAKTGKSKGFGFVLFESEEIGLMAHQAMNRKRVVVGGLTVALRTVPSKHAAEKEIEVSPVLYVRNIPRYVSKEAVEKMLESLGSVVFCAMREEPDGLPVWVVLVEYDCQQCADNALSYLRINTSLYPRQRPPVIAKYAKPMDRRRHAPKPNAVPCPFKSAQAFAEPTTCPIAPLPPSYTSAIANQPPQSTPFYFQDLSGPPNLYTPPQMHDVREQMVLQPQAVSRPFTIGSFSSQQQYAQPMSLVEPMVAPHHAVITTDQMSGGVATFTAPSFAPFSQMSMVTAVTGMGSSAHRFASSVQTSQTTSNTTGTNTTTKGSSDPLQNSSNTTRTAATVASTASLPLQFDDSLLGSNPNRSPGLSPATPLATRFVAHLPAPTASPPKRTKHLSRANHAKLLKGLENVHQDHAMPIIGFIPHNGVAPTSPIANGSFTDEEHEEANSLAATAPTVGTNLTSSLQRSQNTGANAVGIVAPPTMGAPPTAYSQAGQQGSVFSVSLGPEWQSMDRFVGNPPASMAPQLPMMVPVPYQDGQGMFTQGPAIHYTLPQQPYILPQYQTPTNAPQASLYYPQQQYGPRGPH